MFRQTILLLILASAVAAPAAAQASGELLRRADDSIEAGEMLEARQTYEQAIASGAVITNDFVRCRNLGMAYLYTDPTDVKKAADWLQAALKLRPSNTEVEQALANALAWDRQFDAALVHYLALQATRPDDLELKLQTARVLSWAKRYPESIATYDAVIKAGNADVAVQVERARVLSWAKRFPESIAAYDAVLQTGKADASVKIERARVLSWSRGYQEALRGYDSVLAEDPNNLDAQVGKAQVLYWSGHPDKALPLVTAVLAQDARNSAANFLMASLQHSLGNDSSALNHLAKVTPDDESRALRGAISSSTRPVLHMDFGWLNDREEPFAARGATYRTLRYSAGIEFNLTPSIRMDVTNTTAQNATSSTLLARFGDASLANQTMARLYFSPKRWLRVEAGAGVGSTGADLVDRRRQHALYAFHPVVTRGPVRLDLTATRTLADYTPFAVGSGLVQDRQSAAASYTWRKRVRVAGEYWHSFYSFDDTSGTQFNTQANGGALGVVPVIFSRERVSVEGGVRYELTQFSDDTAAIFDPARGPETSGIFMPRLYQRFAGTMSVWFMAQKHVEVYLNGTVGPQRVFGFAVQDPPAATFGMAGTFGAKVTLTGWRLQPYVAYEWFSTETPASPELRPGNYRSHYAAAGLRYRF